jgi:hypothetical protein
MAIRFEARLALNADRPAESINPKELGRWHCFGANEFQAHSQGALIWCAIWKVATKSI